MQKPESIVGREPSEGLADLSPGDEWIQRWLAGERWRLRVERALRPSKVTFSQWRVLDALARLIDETNDAVSQIQVARHLQMGKTTLCGVLQRLERRGLVDQAPAFSSTANRIFLTEVGKDLARQGRSRLDAVSAAGFLGEGRRWAPVAR